MSDANNISSRSYVYHIPAVSPQNYFKAIKVMMNN